MATLLITRPLFDHTTHYLFHWSKTIINFAKTKKNKVIDVKEDRVNKKTFDSVLRKMNPNLVLLNGHGEKDVVLGQNNEPILIAGENEDLLAGRIIYALACKSAQILGKKSIESGAIAYIGYKEDFLFYTNSSYSARPLDDPRAKMFLEPSNLISISLLKSHTTQEACEKSKSAILKNIQHLTAINSPDQFMIPDLLWNMENLECLVDQNAIINSQTSN